MDLLPFLRLMAKKKASDLFFSSGARPSIKIEGTTYPVGKVAVSAAEIEKMAFSSLSEAQRREFEQEMELNLAIAVPEYGRFRINVYRQKGDVGLVVRYISNRIPSLDELQLPAVLADLTLLKRGLVLIVGATGSGKSTTMASMIDNRNERMSGHILSIEDPIEYLHVHKQSVVDQREVGIDTLSYAKALKNALRQAPDMIVIGEIRDKETMQQAMAYAETGHLCLSTLHANNANQALERIVNFFPDGVREQLQVDLSLNLHAVISQRLVVGVDGKRLPAVEVLLRTPFIASLIEKGDIDGIKKAMIQGGNLGMQTFDDALIALVNNGKVSAEEAISHADSKTDLSVKLRLASGGLGLSGNEFAFEGQRPPGTKFDEFGREQLAAAPSPWRK